MTLENDTHYNQLLDKIGETLTQGRVKAIRAVQNIHLMTYWHIGRYIVEFEQQGNTRAEYGTFLFDRLSTYLTERYGKGFGCSNLIYIQKIYLFFPISGTVSHLFLISKFSLPLFDRQR